ncbi:MAG: hypothetical protein ABFD07_07620 [Methanobacterium sp.]
MKVNLKKHDMRMAAGALTITLSKGLINTGSILTSYRCLVHSSLSMQLMQLPPTIVQMPEFQTDDSRYDYLFRKRTALRCRRKNLLAFNFAIHVHSQPPLFHLSEVMES